MTYDSKPIRPRKNLAPRFPSYYPIKINSNSTTKNNNFKSGVYILILIFFLIFFYSIPIRPKIISERLVNYSFSHSLASSLSPPTLPSIHYLLPPKDLSKNLAYCSTLCQAQEWNEDNHFKLRSPEQISEDVFGQKINYEGTYSKDWPFLVRNTDQFALNSIISLRMLHLSKSQNTSLTTLDSADFVYIAVDTRQIARCFGGCRGLTSIPNLDRKSFKIEIVDWLMETIASLKNRRNYPSIILSLSLIDHDYEYNILSEKSQEVVRDDLIVLGIERNPWTTHDSLKYFEQVPYPSTLHLPFYDTISKEKEGRKKLADWTKERERIYLLSFAGRSQPILNNSGKGVLNGFGIRTLIANQLAKSIATDLHLHYFTSASPRTSNSLALIHTAMSKATFCLQPAGDSPTRRAVYESILLGCIPVLFRKGGYKTFSDYSGMKGKQLGGLRLENDLAIFIDEDLMLENDSIEGGTTTGDGIDLVSILRNWDSSEIERIRKNMRDVAGWMQFSMPKSGNENWLNRETNWSEDAFGMILRRLAGLKGK